MTLFDDKRLRSDLLGKFLTFRICQHYREAFESGWRNGCVIYTCAGNIERNNFSISAFQCYFRDGSIYCFNTQQTALVLKRERIAAGPFCYGKARVSEGSVLNLRCGDIDLAVHISD